MKHFRIALLNLFLAASLSAQQQSPLYILYNASCMDQLEYRYVYNGSAVLSYLVRPNPNEQYLLTAGSSGLASPTLPKGTVNCREYTLNDQFFNDVNNLSRQVYIVLQTSKGYTLLPIIAATQVMRSGTYYMLRAPNYAFAIDTANLVYESNLATGTSAWYIYFNGLKIRSCFYEYSFKREPTKANQERSEFDFIPGVGITSERTGMNAADAENNHLRLIKVNGMALEDYIAQNCRPKTTSTTPPLSQWSPQFNYGSGGGVGAVREDDKERASLQKTGAPGVYNPNAVLPPPLVNCPEPPGEGYHIVQPRETLNGISRAYKVSVKSLIGWNKLRDPDKIQVCQKIWVRKPPANASAPTFAYKTGEENPATYSYPNEMPVARQDMYWNNPNYVQPNTYNYNIPAPNYTSPAPAPAPAYNSPATVHTVQRGETLYGIGLKYGLSEADMRRINNYPSAGDVMLQPGMQVLVADCCPQQRPAPSQPAYNPAPNYQAPAPTYPPLNTSPQPAYNPNPNYNYNPNYDPNYNSTYTPPAYNPNPANPGSGGVLPDLFSSPGSTQPATYSNTNQPNPAPASTQTTNPTYFQEYIVREGDTITAVAIKYKVSPQELALVNNKDPNESLIAGQRLLIPKN